MGKLTCRIYSNKRRGASLIFRVTSAAVLIFLWTDTELNLELRIIAASGCGAYSRAALINFFVADAALIRGRRLIEGGAYSSKYGKRCQKSTRKSHERISC